MLHRHCSRRGRVVQRAVHRLAPSGHEEHRTRDHRRTGHRGRREDGNSEPLVEAFPTRTRIRIRTRPRTRAVVLRCRGVLPAQSRLNKVGVGRGGIRRGENLNVWRVRVGRAAVDKVAVV